jgi:putative holliday junction resolvase
LRLMGIDVGESRIGIALSDPLGKTAQPFDTIARDGESASRIAGLASEQEVGLIVAGMPLLMDGTEGRQARLVRVFTSELSEATTVRIAFVDERLTTKQAEAVLAEGKVKRGKKKEASDRVAAALILRAYMDGPAGG